MKCEEAKQTGRKEGEGVCGRRRMRRIMEEEEMEREEQKGEGEGEIQIEGEKKCGLGRGGVLKVGEKKRERWRI